MGIPETQEVPLGVGGARHIGRLLQRLNLFSAKVSLRGEAASAWIYLTLCLTRTPEHFTTTFFYLVGFLQRA